MISRADAFRVCREGKPVPTRLVLARGACFFQIMLELPIELSRGLCYFDRHALVAQLDRASDFDSEGREFESLRARHFGTEPGTPKPAVFALEAATSVRRSALFDPMMRSSF
jgi:hypothetical protein